MRLNTSLGNFTHIAASGSPSGFDGSKREIPVELESEGLPKPGRDLEYIAAESHPLHAKIEAFDRDTHRSRLTDDETIDVEQDVPEFQLDPFELAYLRGGSRELLKLYLFELIQKGYLIVTEKKRWFGTDRWLVVAPDLPPLKELTEIGHDLLSWFSNPQTASNIFSHAFPEGLKAYCARYRTNLLERGILTGWLVPENKFSNYWPYIGFAGFGLLIFANHGGELNLPSFAFVAYIVTMILFGLVLSWFFDIRLTASGNQYLKRLENQFDHLRDQLKTARHGVSEPEHLIAIAVFGTGILAGSSYDAFAESLGDSKSGGYGIETGGGCDGNSGGCGGCGG
jgi:uncharacterized protein (TIGR04222 family)